MEEFNKPNVVISRCLGFDACRYNGMGLKDDFIEALKDYINIITVCPEVSIGLSTPRDPIRVVSINNKLELFQPKTNNMLTEKIVEFSNDFLNNIKEIDGFILKSSSPSCGFKNVKVYNGLLPSSSSTKGSGFFGASVSSTFPYTAIEDEGRLTNYRIRNNFLIKIFTSASFRKVKATKSMKELVDFHSKNKLMLMAYSQKHLKELGKIVSNHDKKPVEDIFNEYEKYLQFAFEKIPRYTSNINVLMHALGYFSKEISQRERSFILENFEKYKNGTVHINTPVEIIKSYAIRFEINYLLQQTFFQPYPEELISLRDSKS